MEGVLLEEVRQQIGGWLRKRSIRRDHSRYGWRTAPAYTAYHRKAQKAFESSGTKIEKFAAESKLFAENQFVSARTDQSIRLLSALGDRIKALQAEGREVLVPAPFVGESCGGFPEIEELFKGDLGDLIRAAFQSEFKIAMGICLYKEGSAARPKQWHSDSGPGTCLNVFTYISDGEIDNGPTALLPWKQSEELFMEDYISLRRHIAKHPEHAKNKVEQGRVNAAFYDREIARRFADKVSIPAGGPGLMVLFNNNVLHAAGSPVDGKHRLVAVFRVYPAVERLDLAKLAKQGISGKKPIPAPDATF